MNPSPLHRESHRQSPRAAGTATNMSLRSLPVVALGKGISVINLIPPATHVPSPGPTDPAVVTYFADAKIMPRESGKRHAVESGRPTIETGFRQLTSQASVN